MGKEVVRSGDLASVCVWHGPWSLSIFSACLLMMQVLLTMLAAGHMLSAHEHNCCDLVGSVCQQISPLSMVLLYIPSDG